MLSVSLLAPCLVRVKTNICFQLPSVINLIIKSVFFSLATGYTFWIIASTVVFSGVASTCTGWCKIPIANCLISLEKVAENSKFCLFEGNTFKIRSISRKNPMSSILSASSKTKISTLASDIKPWFCKSINRPGVATKISTPWRNCVTCGF